MIPLLLAALLSATGQKVGTAVEADVSARTVTGPKVNGTTGAETLVNRFTDVKASLDALNATSTSLGSSRVQIGGDLGGTVTAPQVVGSHLASPLPEAQGGTAAATMGAGAITATGSTTARALKDRAADVVYVEDFLPKNYVTDGSVDYTSQIQLAWAITPRHGRILFPVGRFHVTSSLIVRSGMKINGAGNVDIAYGNFTQADALAQSTYLFGTPANGIFYVPGAAPPTGNYDVTEVTISDLSLGPTALPAAGATATAGSYGVRMVGGYPYHVQGLTVQDVTFYDFNFAVTVEGTSGIGWNAEGVLFKRCRWRDNTIAVYMDSVNADNWRISDSAIYMPANGFGVYGNRTGYFSLDNVIGGGTDWTAAGGDFIYLRLTWDQIQLRAVQVERAANLLHVAPPAGGATDNTRESIQLIGSISECASTVERAAKIDSFASRYSHPIAVTGSAGVIISSVDDTFVTPFDPSQVQSITGIYSAIGASDWVTVLATSHGLSIMDRIDAEGCSSTAFNVLDAQVIPDNANQFRYLAPGVGAGSPVTRPAITKLARWKVEPGDGNTLKAWPPKDRQFTGTPAGSLTPTHLGEEVFDRTNKRWYRSIGSTASDWAALN